MPDKLKRGFSAQTDSLWRLIGNTPLLAIYYSWKGGPAQRILVKCEQYNLTGSIKDRMALYILQKAKEMALIKPNEMIVEATSGNTGIAFAAIGRALGHRVRIIMPDWMSVERRSLIKSFDAEIELVSKEQGGFKGSICRAEHLGTFENVFLPRQFENRFNVEAHEQTTGREIGFTLMLENIRPAAFVAGVGTGGTVMGVGNSLRFMFPEITIHPLEPAESPTLTTGYKTGSHRIQGISDEFIPAIVDLKSLDSVVQVSDGDAILMAQALSRALGLGVGISSGANFIGAVKLQRQKGPGSEVVTVFPDDNKKYLSTALTGEEPVKDGYCSPAISLLHYETLERAV
ncbi:MAG: PLP-dependent cysteine synthase family protein [Bacteroidetes bacterium]|nr:PLP-dependent cysteine synthase family protein [Bacteroidota bacterium]